MVTSMFVLFCSLPLTSCGYHIAGRRLDAGRGATIAVPTFTNKTTGFRIEQRLSEAVRQELIHRTKFRVNSQESADVVMTGEVLGITLSPIIFNQQGRGSSYSLIVDMRIKVTDNRTKSIIFNNDRWTF